VVWTKPPHRAASSRQDMRQVSSAAAARVVAHDCCSTCAVTAVVRHTRLALSSSRVLLQMGSSALRAPACGECTAARTTSHRNTAAVEGRPMVHGTRTLRSYLRPLSTLRRSWALHGQGSNYPTDQQDFWGLVAWLGREPPCVSTQTLWETVGAQNGLAALHVAASCSGSRWQWAEQRICVLGSPL